MKWIWVVVITTTEETYALSAYSERVDAYKAGLEWAIDHLERTLSKCEAAQFPYHTYDRLKLLLDHADEDPLIGEPISNGYGEFQTWSVPLDPK